MSTQTSNPSPSKTSKAQWTDALTETLLNILIEEIEAGNRVGNQFSLQGWKLICQKFVERTGFPYTKVQLKNRSSQLRIMFSKWKKLTDRATGLGLDPLTGGITADDSWWQIQAREDPDVLKWQSGPPKFEDLLFQCFGGTYATGKLTHYPHWCDQDDSVSESQVHSAPFGTAPFGTGQHTVQQSQPISQPFAPPTTSIGRCSNSGSTPPGQGPQFMQQTQPTCQPFPPHVGSMAQGQTANARAPGTIPSTSNQERGKKKRSACGSQNISSAERVSLSVENIAKVIQAKSDKLDEVLCTGGRYANEMQVVVHMLQRIKGIEAASIFWIKCLKVLADKLNRWTFMNILAEYPSDIILRWFKEHFDRD